MQLEEGIASIFQSNRKSLCPNNTTHIHELALYGVKSIKDGD